MNTTCHKFGRNLYHFQAGELPADEHRALANHVGGCDRCRQLLELEGGFLRGLKGRLSRAEAPPDLRVRIREALDREAAPRGVSGWLRVTWLVPATLALLLGFVLIPVVPRGGRVLTVDREVTVVDIDCERAGHTLQEQRGCRHESHRNALKVGPGRYWAISLDHDLGRRLAADREARGHRLYVVGDLHTSSGTLHLASYTDRDLELDPSARLGSASTIFAAVAPAGP
jgi:hypothetical protein